MGYKKMIQVFGVDVNKALPKFPDKKNRNFCGSFDRKKTIDSPSRTQFMSCKESEHWALKNVKVYKRKIIQDQCISYHLDSIHPWQTEEKPLQLLYRLTL